MRAFEEEFEPASDAVQQVVPLQAGNWVGGDRDGNPFVTPDVTLATARRASYAILGRYVAALAELTERLSVLGGHRASHSRAARVDRVRLRAAARCLSGEPQAQRRRAAASQAVSHVGARRGGTPPHRGARRRAAAHEPAAYTSAGQLENDLLLVREALLRAGAVHACRTALDPLLAMVRAHGCSAS